MPARKTTGATKKAPVVTKSIKGQRASRKSINPRSDRPYMPGYGISESRKGILPWAWARRRLKDNRNYWLTSLRPDGRPHTMPLWGVWLNDRLYFSTAITSRKSRNLLADPRCTATTEGATEAVIIEGRADVVENERELKPVWRAYKAKYNWSVDGEKLFVLLPDTIFAFIETAEQFSTAATRWRFER